MAPLLALDGVRKRFGRVTVADGVSFTVGPADAVGVVGPNGAGKTSLFGIIAGDLAPDGGTVTFGGRDVTTVGAADRCRLGMGRTYQVPRPFEEMTVFENVLVAAQQGAGARGRAGFARAAEVLDATGLRADANRPAGEVVRAARAEGVAVIWIEHVVRALTQTVDRLLCLAGGHIVGDGTPAQVLASAAVKEVFLGTEATAAALTEAGMPDGASPP